MTHHHPTLDQLAILHGTDKSSKHHNYCVIYEKYLEHLRHEDILFFECGYGGYHYPDRGGQGARMWRDYFTRGTIVSTDLYHKTNVPDGVFFEQGKQNDGEFWRKVVKEYGYPDVFVDDASHINPLTCDTFACMFPYLKSGGLYIIEDLEASYWEAIASDGTDFKGGLNRHGTIMWLLKQLTDAVNCKSNGTADENIKSMHFYENIVFIQKK